jgi:UDPglucose--hexose-1-phosphate uridylyltransferase
MHSLDLVKPDGRALTLYSLAPLTPPAAAPSPFEAPLASRAHLRWHPLRGEWVTYATFRQDRTFLPPPEYDPLAPTVDPRLPTELPAGDWQVAVFDNRFPALGGPAEAAALPPLPVRTAGADGHCEVIVYSQDATGSLASLPLERIELVLAVWADRSARLGGRDDVAYVLPFENRGAEVGVTLHHPHGQIYAYPVVPPVPARMLEMARRHREAEGSGLLETMIAAERADGARMLYEGPHAVAFVPACARYPYEAWVAPIAPVERLEDLSAAQRADLARALKTVILKYDGLWLRPMPYLMAWYQAPSDGRAHPEAHLHAEFYPAYRSRDRLKYLAGTELAAGFYAMDALPEDTARALQAVPAGLER